MDEQAPFAYRADLAEATRAVIRELLEASSPGVASATPEVLGGGGRPGPSWRT